jgi:hypothetical protein
LHCSCMDTATQTTSGSFMPRSKLGFPGTRRVSLSMGARCNRGCRP